MRLQNLGLLLLLPSVRRLLAFFNLWQSQHAASDMASARTVMGRTYMR